MKTPMQEMLEWVNDYPTEVPTIHKSAVIAKAKELLEKEKECFMYYGFECCMMTKQKKPWSLEELFNQTLNTK